MKLKETVRKKKQYKRSAIWIKPELFHEFEAVARRMQISNKDLFYGLWRFVNELEWANQYEDISTYGITYTKNEGFQTNVIPSLTNSSLPVEP